MAWTEERVEKLKTLWLQGMSASQIAKELGNVTRNAVIGKVHRLGIGNRNAAEEEPPSQPAKKEVPKEGSQKKTDAAKRRSLGKNANKGNSRTQQPLKITAGPEIDVVSAEQEAAPTAEELSLAAINATALEVPLLELTERTCKWPIGDPSEGEFYFCGHEVAAGKPYCEAHVKAAYQPMSSRRDRDRQRAVARIANVS